MTTSDENDLTRQVLDLQAELAKARDAFAEQAELLTKAGLENVQLRATADLRARHVQDLQGRLADMTAERDQLQDRYRAVLDHVDEADVEATAGAAAAYELAGMFVDAARRSMALEKERDQLRAAKDAAYAERNQCVAFMAKMAFRLGWPVWLGRHDPADASWDRDWMTILFIQSPTGQLSWHLHDSETPLITGWYEFGGEFPPWDGHTTEEKYERMRRWKP